MLLSELVGFKSELFFEGAVQLRWVDEKLERAGIAAENFVFHGPLYHGVGQEESDVISSSYKLKDTATLVLDILESFSPDATNVDTNPLLLAVAGYGSGKSHFALTVAKLLMAPKDLLACKIIYNIKSADNAIGEKVENLLELIGKPSLVVTLDGMSNFHLGSELSRGIIKQIKLNGLDLGPILELSPRFTYASDFVKRNFDIRHDDFDKQLNGQNIEAICSKLQENDENTYQIIDDIYYKANGSRIPVDGRESAQDLINTVCENYCGDNGFFSNLIILFDEFGRYLEYAAEKPRLAGDSSLQQIFQGIQDNSKLTKFVGFIQYELKAYLNRFSHKELSQLQRYITRFDSANKLYLSTNLETLFAHLIEKKNLAKLKSLIELGANKRISAEVHTVLCNNLPGINKLPVWKDNKKFQKVIVEGCWPLHPLTTWFLTRQQDIVQSRSALTFIKDVLDVASNQNIETEGVFYSIPPAELVLRSMLQEIVAAERAKGGVVAETLQALLEKYQARLNDSQKLLLAGVMILDKLHISTKDKIQIDRLLQLTTGLNDQELSRALQYLSNEIGAVEWNVDLCQYELVADAATRGQFQQMLKKKLFSLDLNIGDLFTARAKFFGDLGDISPEFAETRDIFSRDWMFSSILAHSSNYVSTISNAFEEWKTAEHHDEAKGRVIYLYLESKDDPDKYIETANEIFAGLLHKHKVAAAPLWTIVIHDKDDKISENLSKTYVLEEKFQADEIDKYRRFIPEEKNRSIRILRDEIQASLRQRQFIVAGISDVVSQRFTATAQWIFDHIYPNMFPFPFDGFQTKSGTGPKDCTQLMKALIGRQVSGDWLAPLASSFQNRFNRLFVKVWKVIGGEGKIYLKPGYQPLADLLDSIESSHANQDLTLYDTYNKLLEPPYGFNSSSAGLIIGLLLARELPPRALKHKGENIALQDWLGYVFPSRVAKQYLDKSCLKLTKIIFLSEDSLQRWKKLISELEFEGNLRKKIELYHSALSINRNDPIPEVLEGRFQFAVEKAIQAEAKLGEHTRSIQRFESELEHAARRRSIWHFIKFGGELTKCLRSMEAEKDVWSEGDFEEITKLIDDVVRTICGEVGPWVQLEACNSHQQVPEYRSKLEKTCRDLKLLGLNEDAELVETHKNKVINQIEIRFQFDRSISESKDLIRQAEPNKNTPLWKLNDEISICDKQITNLRTANNLINGSDITNLISQVESRKTLLLKCKKNQKDELKSITNLPLIAISDIKSAKHRLLGQIQIFKGTIDEDYINDLLKQLNIMLSDVESWKSIIMSPEDTDKMLLSRIEIRCTELDKLVEEEDIALEWDFREVYTSIRNELVGERTAQSDRWISTIRPNIDDINRWTIQDCNKIMSNLSELPKYLSTAHLKEVGAIEGIIRSKANEIKELKRNEQALSWIQGIKQQITCPETLNVKDCERLIMVIENKPEYISEKEISQLVEMRDVITARQDSLDVKSIIDRICRLKDDMRSILLKELAKIFDKINLSE